MKTGVEEISGTWHGRQMTSEHALLASHNVKSTNVN